MLQFIIAFAVASGVVPTPTPPTCEVLIEKTMNSLHKDPDLIHAKTLVHPGEPYSVTYYFTSPSVKDGTALTITLVEESEHRRTLPDALVRVLYGVECLNEKGVKHNVVIAVVVPHFAEAKKEKI